MKWAQKRLSNILPKELELAAEELGLNSDAAAREREESQGSASLR